MPYVTKKRIAGHGLKRQGHTLNPTEPGYCRNLTNGQLHVAVPSIVIVKESGTAQRVIVWASTPQKDSKSLDNPCFHFIFSVNYVPFNCLWV